MVSTSFTAILLVCLSACVNSQSGKATEVPKVQFYNGNSVPIIGLGTWKSKPGQVTQAVKDAIDIGYRHIDCAHVYENEKEVGQALKEKIAEGVIKREDIFITSKLWNTYHQPDLVEPALRSTLKNLTLDYVDLYLIHWPTAFQEGDNIYPKDQNGSIIYSNVDYVDTWKAMEEVQKKGLAKSIGLSNFNKKQIDRVLKIATIKPANLQIECHPYLNQAKLIAYAQSKGMTITGYSPLGSPDRPNGRADQPKLIEDPKLIELGKEYKKTAAQIALRYQIQRGVITIPKSVTKSRIQENFDITDFELSAESMKKIDDLNRNLRFISFDQASQHKDFPFAASEEF